MNHIVLGTDDFQPMGMVLGFIGIAVVVLSWVAAHYISWYFPARIAAGAEGDYAAREAASPWTG